MHHDDRGSRSMGIPVEAFAVDFHQRASKSWIHVICIVAFVSFQNVFSISNASFGQCPERRKRSQVSELTCCTCQSIRSPKRGMPAELPCRYRMRATGRVLKSAQTRTMLTVIDDRQATIVAEFGESAPLRLSLTARCEDSKNRQSRPALDLLEECYKLLSSMRSSQSG